MKYRIRFIMLVAAAGLWCSSAPGAETWHLERGGQWKAISQQKQDKYLLAVSEIKKLISAGQSDSVREGLEQLKKDFPEIAAPDLDAFMESEMFFCEAKFTRAIRSYDKVLDKFPESSLYDAALERKFAIGTAFLAGQKKSVLGVFKIRGYAEGRKIMEGISDRAGDSPIALRAAMSVVKSLEKRQKFDEAYHKWSEIQSRWPTGQIGRDSLLGMARCKHAAYKGPKYDASELISAKSYYEDFKLRYPQDAKELEIAEKLEIINEQIAMKKFEIGQYYQKTGNEQSANLYYQMVADNWAGTEAAKMVRKLAGENLVSEEIKK